MVSNLKKWKNILRTLPHFSFILHTFLSNAILVKRKNDSRCWRRNFFPSEVKRETGANPVRSRHCKREMKDTIVTGLTSGKTYFRDDPQARKPACCRYRRLPLRATRTWPYHSDTHAHTDQPVVRYHIREFFLLCLFLPSLHGSFRRWIRDPQIVIHGPPLLSCSPNPAFPVQIVIRSIISLIVAKVCALHRVLQEPHASAR